VTASREVRTEEADLLRFQAVPSGRGLAKGQPFGREVAIPPEAYDGNWRPKELNRSRLMERENRAFVSQEQVLLSDSSVWVISWYSTPCPGIEQFSERHSSFALPLTAMVNF